METSERRIVHGMGWGAAATVVSGAVTLLMMAVHLWPAQRPLSLLVAQTVVPDYLGWTPSPAVAYLLAAAGQLAWGALLGGFLAFLSHPVTLSSALGLGALRWFFTQSVVLPALGWQNYSFFMNRPSIALATMLPHLGWAISLGWLLRQEDFHRPPVIAWRQHLHLARVPRRRRR
jgi:hypothetical protein